MRHSKITIIKEQISEGTSCAGNIFVHAPKFQKRNNPMAVSRRVVETVPSSSSTGVWSRESRLFTFKLNALASTLRGTGVLKLHASSWLEISADKMPLPVS